jgi:hypothetical protein
MAVRCTYLFCKVAVLLFVEFLFIVQVQGTKTFVDLNNNEGNKGAAHRNILIRINLR